MLLLPRPRTRSQINGLFSNFDGDCVHSSRCGIQTFVRFLHHTHERSWSVSPYSITSSGLQSIKVRNRKMNDVIARTK